MATRPSQKARRVSRLLRASGEAITPSSWKRARNHSSAATAAHIHVGGPDVAGPVVLGLTPPTDGRSTGCAQDVDPMLIRELLRNPRGYYVNVHNAEYPGGAIRGQLMHPGNP